MKETFDIITNNPLAAQKYPQMVKYMECGVATVLQAARDEIHLGAVLINHPLSGSIGIGESPCKSLVLTKRRGPLDISSLELIETAIESLRESPPIHGELPQDIIRGFQVIDLDLLDSAVKSISVRI